MKRLIIIFLTVCCCLGCNKPEIDTDVSETFYVRHEGANMPVYVRGNTASNKLILILHGGPGGNGYQYYLSQFAPELGREFGLLALDQRGQGGAQGHYSKDRVTIEQMRQDVKAVVLATRERYGKDVKIYLMGHSWGGLLGTAFAQSEDQFLVDGWIEVAGAHDLPLLYTSAYAMLDSFADVELQLGRERDFWLEVKDGLAQLPLEVDELEDWLTLNRLGHRAGGMIPQIERDSTRDIGLDETLWGNPIDPLTTISSWNTGTKLLDEVIVTNLTPTMSEIQIPTLFLWGRYDFVVPPRLAETGFPLVGTADKEIWWFESSAHSPMFDQPGEYVSVVTDWINRH